MRLSLLLMIMVLTSCIPDLEKCPDTELILDGSAGQSEVRRMEKAASISCSFQKLCLARIVKTKTEQSYQCKELD